MSLEQIFIILIGVACSVIGWFANQLFRAVEKLKDDLNELQVRIGSDFVRYDRLQDMLKPILNGIEEIKESIKHKADKP
jgi:septation ring formation regulator EzrA